MCTRPRRRCRSSPPGTRPGRRRQMSEAIIEHLWQSTWFALAAALLTLLFRRNRADIRFRLWLAASVKFLVPFPLLALLGRQLRWESAPTLHALPSLSM